MINKPKLPFLSVSQPTTPSRFAALLPRLKLVVVLLLMLILVSGARAQSKIGAVEAISDIIIFKNGRSVACIITACDSVKITYKVDGELTADLTTVLTFAVIDPKRLTALDIPQKVLDNKLQYGQDLLVLNNGQRLLTTLLDINSLYFVVQKSSTDTNKVEIPIDSVITFNTNKPFLKRSLEDFSAINRLYAPYQDLDKVMQKDRSTGNWNADYIVFSTGIVVKGIILNADSVTGLTYIPAYFTEQPFTPIKQAWAGVRSIDFWREPNPYREPKWYAAASCYQEPVLKSIFARRLSGNMQFIPTRLQDELKLARQSHQMLFLKGGILLAGGIGVFGWGYQQLGINQRASNDAGVVASSFGMAAGLGLLGFSFHQIYDAVLNLNAYNRLKYIQKTINLSPTGVSLKYQF